MYKSTMQQQVSLQATTQRFDFINQQCHHFPITNMVHEISFVWDFEAETLFSLSLSLSLSLCLLCSGNILCMHECQQQHILVCAYLEYNSQHSVLWVCYQHYRVLRPRWWPLPGVCDRICNGSQKARFLSSLPPFYYCFYDWPAPSLKNPTCW